MHSSLLAANGFFDWPSLVVPFGAALLGAVVGGWFAYRATLASMKHEVDLRRDERLRQVRGEMVDALVKPLNNVNRGLPTAIWTAGAFAGLVEAGRLSYSATRKDRSLTVDARWIPRGKRRPTRKRCPRSRYGPVLVSRASTGS